MTGLAASLRHRAVPANHVEMLEGRVLLSIAPAAVPPVGRFNLFTDSALTTPGLAGTYINRSLRGTVQSDWRATQAIAGRRVDRELNFQTNGWGRRASVGLTHGTDADWSDFSVQWDGFVQILTGGIGLATRSDDGSRMWIDLNRDGSFGTAAPELVSNNWGQMQGATTGPSSPLLEPGVYRIRIQYEEGVGDNSMQLLAAPPPMVRIAYLIPSNRQPQPQGVPNLQFAVRSWQDWYRDQMERNGFGPKTFLYETEEDGLTPRIHVVNVTETDDYIRGDIWGRMQSAASAAGVPIWTPGQVWLLVPEVHKQNANGSIDGGVALGASWGSGNDPGIGSIGSNALPVLGPDAVVNNTPYAGQIIPEIGPYPLVQDVSFAWFEGRTISSLSGTYLGAALHELTHGFGMPHDFRNDNNADGNLMGNGLRGFRGALYPDRYPSDDTYLSYGQALALNNSPYFNIGRQTTDTTPPAVNVSTSSNQPLTSGQLRIAFTASDSSGLAAALLTRNGEQIAEMPLSGTSISTAFLTPYYDAGQAANYGIMVYDRFGNRRNGVEVSITPLASGNRAPKPFVDPSLTTVRLGQNVSFDAGGSSDPDHATSTLKVEWDLNGDGVFDTSPSTSKVLSTSFREAGTRLIQARITDPAGAQSLSAPIGIRVLPTINGTSGGDIYYLRADSADAETLQVFTTATPSGEPRYTVPRSSTRPLVFNAGNGSDRLMIDFTVDDPIPQAGIQFVGAAHGGAGDTLLLMGNGAQSASLRRGGPVGDGSLLIDGKEVSFTGLEPITIARFAAITLEEGEYNLGSDLVVENSEPELNLAGSTLVRAPVAAMFDAVRLNDTSRVLLGSGPRVAIATRELAIAAGALLDVADAQLIVQSTPDQRAAALAAVSRLVKSGRNGGAWDGPGLSSSVARNDTARLTGLAAILNDRGNGQPLHSTFGTLPVDANSILVGHSWNGDVNLSGKVDAADYFAVDSGFLAQSTGYANGDLDYSGAVDAADYFLIDSAFIGQSGALKAKADSSTKSHEGTRLQKRASNRQIL